jgi:DNA-directed RNA polymerase sigma subunit (sigma70/sigma32)
MDPSMAFAVHRYHPPSIEVRVNFGIFAGREATSAEIDRLGQWLLDEVGEVSIISEERHEMDANVEASVHQVRIEISQDIPESDIERKALEHRVLERAHHWMRQCVTDRHAEVADGI